MYCKKLTSSINLIDQRNVVRMLAATDEIGRRGNAAEVPEVVDEMGLVEVAAPQGHVRPPQRFVQGIGGAMASSVVLGMIFTTFPEPRDLAKAIGFFSFVAAAGGALGPLAGGVLTQVISWHWIFFVNVPLGVAAMALAARVLESERGLGLGKGVDVAGAFLVTSGLMLAVEGAARVAARVVSRNGVAVCEMLRNLVENTSILRAAGDDQ